MGIYTIEACQYDIGSVAGHDFWVLKDERGTIVAELHGLAYRPSTKEAIPIGYLPEDELRTFIIPRTTEYADTVSPLLVEDWRNTVGYYFSRKGQDAQTVYTGPDALDRWNAAVNAIPTLNAQKIHYPMLGGASTLYGCLANQQIVIRHTLLSVI